MSIFFCCQKSYPEGLYVANIISWDYGLIDYQTSFAHAICEKFVHEKPMFAFVSKTCFSFQKEVFTKDVSWVGGKN